MSSRRVLAFALIAATAACGDDGSNRLADAPVGPDAAFDASIDAPADVSVAISVTGNGGGTITSDPAGIDCGSTCSADFAPGTVLTLTAVPDAGSVFVGWGGVCAGTTPTCEITVEDLSSVAAAAASITATFSLQTYTVTVTKSGAGTGTVMGNGIACGATCTATIDHGTTISLAATPDALTTFAGWGGACSGTGTCDVTVTSDLAITAAFALDDLTLTVARGGTGTGTVTSSPAGITCGSDCDETYTANQMITLTAAPAVGSTFTGWSGGGCSGTGTCVVTMTSAQVVTASFALNTYALTVVKAGTGTGTVTSSPAGIACGSDCDETYDHGQMITLTAAPSVGTTFGGFSGGGCSTSPCTVTMTAATTVTATFTLNTYALTVSKAGTGAGTVTSSPAGISCGADCSELYNHGAMVTLTAAPTAGSVFAGWSHPSCPGVGPCAITMTAATSVTATFTLNTYALTVMKNGTGAGTVTSSPAGISCGADCTETYGHGTVVTLTATPTTGSTFAGFSGGGCSTSPCTVTMTAAATVTATFTLNTYALTVSRNGTGGGAVTSSPAGIDCGVDCTETYNHGQVVTLIPSPTVGSTFTGWTGGGCPATGNCVVTMTAATSVTATFTLNTYLLTVSKNGTGAGTVTSSPAGISCGADCTQVYGHGTLVTLTAAPTAGSTFGGFSGGGCSTSPCTLTMTAATTVTATFTLNTYALTVMKTGTGAGTVTSSPAGISCGADCTETYGHGTLVTLTAAPTTGSTFGGFSGGGCSTSPCTVTMAAATTVTATFTLNTYVLTVNKNGSGTGSVSSSPAGISCGNDCTQPYGHGTSVTLTATPSTGAAATLSTFTGWTGAGCSGTGTCVVAMTAARTVTATFDAVPNVMFVTKATSLGALGDLAGADNTCQTTASQAGLVGNGPGQNQVFRAWLSTSAISAASRLNGASGWVRRDGRPVFNTVSDIASHKIIYPPRLDESGADVGALRRVWTGTNNAGTYAGGGQCPQNFGMTSIPWSYINGDAMTGFASGTSGYFTNYTAIACTSQASLYCMGTDRAATVVPTAQAGRLAFTSSASFTPTSGIAAADAICQSEANAQSLGGTYRALLARSGFSAISRFNTTGSTWVRVGDRVPIVPTAATLATVGLSVITTTPSANADGTRVLQAMWTGARDPATAGTLATTCNNWSTGAETGTIGNGGDTSVSLWFGGATGVSCSIATKVICLQE